MWLVEGRRCADTLYIRVEGGFSRLWGGGGTGIFFFFFAPFLMGCGSIVLSLCPKITCIKTPEVLCGCVYECVFVYV